MDRHGHADADGHDAVVDPVAEQIEPACAEILRLEAGAELDHELADRAGDGLGGPDRLGEGTAGGDDLERPDRFDRFGEHTRGLVQPATELGAEAPRQRCPRLCQQIADPREAEDA